METDAEAVGRLPRSLQQFCRFIDFNAEFRCQADFREFRGNAQPDAQRQIVCAVGAEFDLFQFLDAVERENPHAMIAIGFADRGQLLDRIHVAQGGVGQGRARHPHFVDRSDVEIGNAFCPQQFQQGRRRICLYRIERLAGKLVDKITRRATRCVWPVQQNWNVWA